MHNHLKALTSIVYSIQDNLNEDLAYTSQILFYLVLRTSIMQYMV